MEKDIKTTVVEINDQYGNLCLGDSVGKECSIGERRPQGIVEIYDVDKDGKKQLVRKSNLVVYRGRESLAQFLVNQSNTLLPVNQRALSHHLYWFGLGDGGALPADPFVPVPPANENDDLESRVMILASSSEAADYHTAGVGYPKTGYYKIPFDQITFEADPYNDNRYFVLKIETTVDVASANTEELSEAGLFTATSGTPGHAGTFLLFARVTFPTILKDDNRRLLFTWYLYV
jgi:hypothetical protein